MHAKIVEQITLMDTVFYLDFPNIEEVSSKNWHSLCGGTKKTCVAVFFAETVNFSLLVGACLGRKPTAPHYKPHFLQFIGCNERQIYQTITKCEFVGRQPRCRKCSYQSRWPRYRNNWYVFVHTQFRLHPNSESKMRENNMVDYISRHAT